MRVRLNEAYVLAARAAGLTPLVWSRFQATYDGWLGAAVLLGWTSAGVLDRGEALDNAGG